MQLTPSTEGTGMSPCSNLSPRAASPRSPHWPARRRDALNLEKHRLAYEEEFAEVLYDELAMGWNEIFQADSAVEASAEPPCGTASHPAAALRASGRAAPSSARNAKSAELLPDYLHSFFPKRTAIEQRMREEVASVPLHVARRNADFVDVQLDNLRKSLTQEQRAGRREKRYIRRLGRRCGVKGHESLDELEERYATSSLEPLPADPADRMEECLSAPASPLARNFFRELSQRHEKRRQSASGRPIYLPAVSAVATRRDAAHLPLSAR